MLDNRLLTTNDRLDDDKQTPDLPNENLSPNYSTPTVSPIPSHRIDLTLNHQLQAIGSTGSKENNETGEDEQIVIDLTDKVDKDHPMKHHEKLSQESFINFSGTINTDTHTIEGRYNTINSTVLGAPKTTGSSSLDELHNRLDEQARLLNE